MRPRGPWSAQRAADFLESAVVPLRLACNGSTGTPILASLWFVPEDGRLWCATQRSARIVSLLREDPRCAFEVAQDAPPYCGVRGQGEAVLDEARGAVVLDRLIERYVDPASDFAKWLRSRANEEVAIGIEPSRTLSWDFAERMR